MPKKQTEWSRNYNEKAYDRLAVTIPKGRKETVDAYAKEHGESINGLVNLLLREAIGLTEAEWKSWNVQIIEKENIIDPDTMEYHDSEVSLRALDGLHTTEIRVEADTPMEAIEKARDKYEPVFNNSRTDYRVTIEEPTNR